ncbi:MAG TPA: hypothetical protein DDW49_01240, partial [Deltaproteobacteria bacterium]|nr:hypothetical protein [Deltaproteobacteria bacterium]
MVCIWIFLILLYLTPLCLVAFKLFSFLWLLLSYPLRLTRNIMGIKRRQRDDHNLKGPDFLGKINYLLGNYEYIIRSPRNYSLGFVVTAYLIITNIRSLIHNQAPGENQIYPLILLILTFYTIHHEILTNLKMAEILRTNPSLHPRLFFDIYKNLLGPFFYSIPEKMETISPLGIQFGQTGRSQKSIKPTLNFIGDTAHLAHVCLKALKYVGHEYAREVFDPFASMWGKRLLQVVGAQFEIIGSEKLQNLTGKNILVFNHKSQLDFILAFFALSHIRLASKRGVKVRFITAKDHFLDNPFIYDFLG